MNQDKAIPISVTALRADEYSPDGENIVISIVTRYSKAERRYSMPVACVRDFVVDLQRLSAHRRAASNNSNGAPLQPADEPNPAE
jgi:hypothetical protein